MNSLSIKNGSSINPNHLLFSVFVFSGFSKIAPPFFCFCFVWILDGVTPETKVWREEIFGPVLASATFRDDFCPASQRTESAPARPAQPFGKLHLLRPNSVGRGLGWMVSPAHRQEQRPPSSQH